MELADNEITLEFYQVYKKFRYARVGLIKEREANIQAADKYEDYWNRQEINYKEAVLELQSKTRFQQWVGDIENYKQALRLLIKQKPHFMVRKGEECDQNLLCVEMEWRLQFIFAAAILVYMNPQEAVSKKLIDDGLVTAAPISPKTTNAAKKLKQYLADDHIYFPSLERMLDRVCMGDLPSGCGQRIYVNEQQRKKLLVREIALAGRNSFLPRGTRKGRFSPDIATCIADLFYPGIDRRSVELFMKPYDIAEIDDVKVRVGLSSYVALRLEREIEYMKEFGTKTENSSCNET